MDSVTNTDEITVPKKANFLAKALSFGNMPFFAVLILCATSFYLGQHILKPTLKIATFEKGALLLDAVLTKQDAHPEMPIQQLKNEINTPLLGILKKYQAMGYVVVDTSLNDRGFMEIDALPQNAIDITAEARLALDLPPLKPSKLSSSK